jgi:GH15 family glucan-1,4-alpha-glucosidase
MSSEAGSITDHLLIGNCRTAALVSKTGSITWCCIPEFHSPSIFAALLDNEKGGFFLIQPVHAFRCKHAYIPDTNVSRIVFENEEGSVSLTDCFVAMEENEKRAQLFADHEIIRIAEGISGAVKMRFVYFPRTYYGKYAARLKDQGKLGIQFSYKENVCIFQTSLPEAGISDSRDKVEGMFVLNKGDRVIFSVSCSTQYPAVIPEIKLTAIKRLESTVRYWQTWIGKCKYEGPFKEWVRRSALTLKLLAHAPSGAIIAAPTTSLPEWTGGSRNWDYRFCWLRDASFTVRVLMRLGYYDEAHAYMNWILHATRLTQPALQVVYTVFGNARINEQICDWLPGYKKSAPVRIGNDAHSQFQLDVYGEVLDAVYAYSGIVGGFDRGAKKFIMGLGKTICKHWGEPDDGIWEMRSARRQHTHSKVMAWVGLDRLIKLCEKYHWDGADKERFEKTKALLQRSIEERGFNKQLNSYVSEFDGKHVDAALLTFSLVEYRNAKSPAMAGTIDRIRDQLGEQDFIYRYLHGNDGLQGREGAFLVASFWLIGNLARMGKTEEAIALFQRTIDAAPAHGLLSEEIEPGSKEWLGNYPQGFSHIGLIGAALAISEALSKKQQP